MSCTSKIQQRKGRGLSWKHRYAAIAKTYMTLSALCVFHCNVVRSTEKWEGNLQNSVFFGRFWFMLVHPLTASRDNCKNRNNQEERGRMHFSIPIHLLLQLLSMSSTDLHAPLGIWSWPWQHPPRYPMLFLLTEICLTFEQNVSLNCLYCLICSSAKTTKS